MSHNFNVDDRVKVVHSVSPFHGMVGKVSTSHTLTVWVKFPNTHGQPIAFNASALTHVSPVPPKKGDRVRITKPTGKWTAHEGEVLHANAHEVRVDLDYDVIVFEVKHVEIIESFGPNRVEGQPIRFEDVKVGDTVETLKVSQKNGIEHKNYLTGVVGTIGTRAKNLSTREGGTLYGIAYQTEITLIKDVDKDGVLSKLEDLAIESVIEYNASDIGTTRRTWIAVKTTETTWRLLSPSGIANPVRTTTLRDYLKRDGNNTFELLKEGK